MTKIKARFAIEYDLACERLTRLCRAGEARQGFDSTALAPLFPHPLYGLIGVDLAARPAPQPKRQVPPPIPFKKPAPTPIRRSQPLPPAAQLSMFDESEVA